MICTHRHILTSFQSRTISKINCAFIWLQICACGCKSFYFLFFLILRPRAWFSWVCRRCTTSRSKFTCNWNLPFSNDFFLLYFPLFSLPTNVKSQKLTYFDGPKFALYFTYNDVTPMKITTRVSNLMSLKNKWLSSHHLDYWTISRN